MHRLTAWLKSRRKFAWVPPLAIAAVIGASADSCDGQSSADKAKSQEQSAQDRSYTTQVRAEPEHVMTYPMTRKTINFWIDTWNKPGQLAYVYLRNVNGDPVGYYVTRGLPVSYCVSLSPTEHVRDDDSGNLQIKDPSIDAAFYSGGDCLRYYAQDANTGKYLEWTTGQGQQMLIYSEPGPAAANVKPLGYTNIGNVHLPASAKSP